MLIKNTPARFGLFSKLLHWLIAILILGLIWLGWYMVDLTYYDKWYNDSLHYHKSLGILALALALVKIGWQQYTPASGPLAGLQSWERIGAKFMHYVLLGHDVINSRYRLPHFHFRGKTHPIVQLVCTTRRHRCG